MTTPWMAEADQLLQTMMAVQPVPGMAVAVIRPGESSYIRTFGSLRVTGSDPVTPTKAFHVASITKTFTAATILKLVEQGHLSLNAPITNHLPAFDLTDPRGSTITVAQLLSHLSGLPDLDNYHCWDDPAEDADAPTRALAGLRDTRLLQPPGDRFFYSNIGYDVLGALITAVTGQPYEDAVEAFILDPLGMTASTLYDRRADRDALAWPHVLTPDGAVVASALYPYHRAHAPSSTLTTSINDIAPGWGTGWIRAPSARSWRQLPSMPCGSHSPPPAEPTVPVSAWAGSSISTGATGPSGMGVSTSGTAAA